MPRSARLVPACTSLGLVLVLALTACGASGTRGAAGGAGVGDPYFPQAGNGGFDVSHYALRLSYDPDAEHVSGTATVTARATADLSAFDLDLEGMDVAEVTVGGRTARWDRAGQELTVRPGGGLAKGEIFEVRVRYSGTPQTITDPDGSEEGWLPTEDGAVGLGEPTGSMAWFPGSHHPSDKASYDVVVTVPEGLEAVSNGELARRATRDGRTTFTWRTAEPMASHAVTLAVGDYAVSRSTAGDLPVYTAVAAGQEKASEEVLARLPEVLRWAEGNFGPYPFASTGAIVGGAADAGYALETQNRPFFPGAPDTGLLVHELAHQWFGDSVTPRTWRDMWLNEGFATYAEWLWEEDEGGDSAEETFDALYDHGEDRFEDLWAFPPARPTSAAHISDEGPVYQRAAMVVHKIRQTVGDDAFHDIVQGWTAAHRHGNADTEDFTAYVERRAPDEDFDGIWADWLYGEGKPEHR